MNRLQSYRFLEGLSQDALAEQLAMDQRRISQFERGTRPFTGDLTVLGYRPDRLEVPTMSEPLHRHRASTLVTAKNRAKELLRLGGEVFKELAASHRIADRRLELERSLDVLSSTEDIDSAAADLRSVLGVEPSGPIKDLTAMIERAGVCVIPIVGLNGIDGVSAWVEDVPVIGISPRIPGDRFRLTLGHEMAHLLHHRTSSSTSEAEANRFASALLFPSADFHAAVGDDDLYLKDFVHLKRSWGVSAAALIYRAHEDGVIGPSRYRALQIQMSRWRKKEPGEFQPVLGKLFPKLVQMNGGIPAVAGDLGVNPSHLQDLVNWSHLRLV